MSAIESCSDGSVVVGAYRTDWAVRGALGAEADVASVEGPATADTLGEETLRNGVSGLVDADVSADALPAAVTLPGMVCRSVREGADGTRVFGAGGSLLLSESFRISLMDTRGERITVCQGAGFGVFEMGGSDSLTEVEGVGPSCCCC